MSQQRNSSSPEKVPFTIISTKLNLVGPIDLLELERGPSIEAKSQLKRTKVIHLRCLDQCMSKIGGTKGPTKIGLKIFSFRSSRYYQCARAEYTKDKQHAEKNRDRDEMFISVDMQKVILLPRLEQYKSCLSTRRLIMINQSFVLYRSEIRKAKGHVAFSGMKEYAGATTRMLRAPFIR